MVKSIDAATSAEEREGKRGGEANTIKEKDILQQNNNTRHLLPVIDVDALLLKRAPKFNWLE